MKGNNIMKNLWLALAIVIAILMPIYGAWHHIFTLCICVGMYYAYRSEERRKRISPSSAAVCEVRY